MAAHTAWLRGGGRKLEKMPFCTELLPWLLFAWLEERGWRSLRRFALQETGISPDLLTKSTQRCVVSTGRSSPMARHLAV